ncbi:hypothetical protein PAXRUDRAFT_826238 [Paxillus rubicundulus Ve08.2h10]|uniref:Uncharacterized protein n=1 Tax=Paxillus rubicundulus Ve08.2h10 TaxID=930991 RepID=A0A0D0E9Z1_9AGAM|nr:hypothetical protein PAXRUDRAFT_826238 [Paxillus rubicundulus Ve08.2h10]
MVSMQTTVPVDHLLEKHTSTVLCQCTHLGSHYLSPTEHFAETWFQRASGDRRRSASHCQCMRKTDLVEFNA